jgi:hypothetical protein
MKDKWAVKENRKRGLGIRALNRVRPGGPETGTRCPPPCGKMRFTTRKLARQAIRQMRSDGRHEAKTMRAYPCLVGPYFHITSAAAHQVEYIRKTQAERQERRNGDYRQVQ